MDPGTYFTNPHMTAKGLMCQGVPFSTISEWLSKGLIVRTERGVYSLPGTKDDVYALIQGRYRRCVFSGITALNLLGLSNHVSERYHVTFPKGYNPSSLDSSPWKLSVTRSVPEIYDLGICTVTTPGGDDVRVYCRERALCDMFRGKGLPAFIVSNAMRTYMSSDSRDTELLMSYAERLHVSDRVRIFTEML